MRAYLFALLGMGVLAVTGCKGRTAIGHKCGSNSDCTVTGQVCATQADGATKICTKACTTQAGATGCPVGFDCYMSDAEKGATCNKATYELDTNGNALVIGKDCSTNDLACANFSSQAAGLICRKLFDTSQDPPTMVQNDPNAFCTVNCASQSDCPVNYRCDTDEDMVKRCLRRTLCGECTVDANCPSDYPYCVAATTGPAARYCTKGCQDDTQCGGNQNSAYTCKDSSTSTGMSVKACLHRYGACVGEGNICDPCRKEDDCKPSSSHCLFNNATGEGFCSKGCSDDSDCAQYGAVVSVCDNTDIATQKNPYGMSLEICNGDTGHDFPGLVSCWVPQQ